MHITRKLILALVALALVPATADAQRQPYGTNDYGGFRSVLPPGTNGVFNVTDYTLFLANGTCPPHTADQLPLYRDLMYATPGADLGGHRQVLQERDLRRPGRAGGAHVQPARRGDRGPRQGLRRAARVRDHPRRHALRGGLRGRRGQALLHGRAPPRRARAAVGLRRRGQQGDGQGRVGVVALHRGRPPEAGRPDGRPLRTRGRRAPAGRGRLRGRHQPVHRARRGSTRRSCRPSTRLWARRSRTGRPPT